MAQRFTAAERTAKQDLLFEIYGGDKDILLADALRQAGIPDITYERWRKNDYTFRAAIDALKYTKNHGQIQKRRRKEIPPHLIVDPDKAKPDIGDFATFRREYLGRPVAAHQEHIVSAYEDRTNRFVMILGPTGSGKDTTALDIVLHAAVPDFSMRVAWIMPNEKFSARRLSERGAPYLTDPKTYLTAPEGPDTTIPTRSLIDDFGPFQWEKGMIWSDGTPVPQTTWNKHEIYFAGTVGAKESDPNLWSTGINGQLYGSRVKLMVVSDPFDRENQLSVERAKNVEWFKGTLRSRLDTKGRLVILGTRVLPGDDYEVLMDYFIGNATVLWQSDDGYYTKYRNGFASVIYPALETTDAGETVSYWPEQFPLESYLEMPDGQKYLASALTDDEYLDLAGRGAEVVEGLLERRAADKTIFDTTMQQAPPKREGGQFSDLLLDNCDDPTRSFGQVRPGDILVQGVDPATFTGTAWAMVAANREDHTITLVDYGFGKKLGVEGLRDEMVLGPIFEYRPSYMEYESNQHKAVLKFPEVIQVAKEHGVKVTEVHTQNNRNIGDLAVTQIAFDMRDGTLRFPAALPTDLDKLRLVKEHFHNWDTKTELRTLRTKAWMRIEDDIVMAIWVAWMRAKALLGKRPNHLRRAVEAMIPEVTQRAWSRYAPKQGKWRPPPPATDLVAVYYQGTDGEHDQG
jgi:hypothetical protein